jgi:stearoyl-CoA desaturase (delta-9 desaturase)
MHLWLTDILDGDKNPTKLSGERWQWDRLLPFAFLHLGCLAAFWTSWSWTAVAMAIGLYWSRMFLVTGWLHRYFSHKTFQTNRFWQAVFGALCLTTVQRGPLWWAAHHRHHHRHSDEPDDIHSPKQRGFWWSHLGWICCDANIPTRYENIPELVKFPELVWLNRFDWLGSAILIICLWIAGEWLNSTTGAQLVVWGYFISTVVLFHGTCTINSLSHVFGNQRFNTGDTSRNNGLLAIVTMGEGWHNNHHFYPGATRQGFYWWEIDATYAILKTLSWVGIVKNLHPVPTWVYTKTVSSQKPQNTIQPSVIGQQPA